MIVDTGQISAQESRRKKKEYMDSLERKVDILVTENGEYKKKIINLEESNGSLVQQLQKLQKLLGLQATQIVSINGFYNELTDSDNGCEIFIIFKFRLKIVFNQSTLALYTIDRATRLSIGYDIKQGG